jgi:hypothetical protein
MTVKEAKLSRLPLGDEPVFNAEEERAWRFYIAGLRPMSSWLLRASDEACKSRQSIKDYVGPVAVILASKVGDVYLGPAAVLDVEERFFRCGPVVKISNDSYTSIGLWVPRKDMAFYAALKSEHVKSPENSIRTSLIGVPDWPATNTEATTPVEAEL